jgi:hypothetical protein
MHFARRDAAGLVIRFRFKSRLDGFSRPKWPTWTGPGFQGMTETKWKQACDALNAASRKRAAAPV